MPFLFCISTSFLIFVEDKETSMDEFIVLTLGHAQTVHKWTNEDISSPFVRMFYVKKGTAVLHLNEQDIQLSAGHMYLLPSYTPHAYECEPEFEFYYLFVYQRKMEMGSLFDVYDIPYEVQANLATQLLFENYCNLYPQLVLPSRDAEAFLNHQAYRDYAQAFMQMEWYERMQLHGLVEILISYFVKHAKRKQIVNDERIAKVLDYVNQNVAKSITIEELADKACLTKSYLIRVFRQNLGITPLQYVIRKKIQYSQTLLLESDMTIQQVATTIGIPDVSYFIRLFKKNLGFTPQEYRLKLIG